MALTQMQLIQSLGEALAWLEREKNWDIPATELRHLCGRIGELYACVVTNGQMAQDVNQKGYDVRAASGRISVKTTATSGWSGHVSFNAKTLDQVDRVMVLRINLEEMQIETLLDLPIGDAKVLMKPSKGGKLDIALRKMALKKVRTANDKVIKSAQYLAHTINELESGSIEVWYFGARISPAKPTLRTLASHLGISLLNGQGNPYNTRQLGSLVIEASNAMEAVDAGNLSRKLLGEGGKAG